MRMLPRRAAARVLGVLGIMSCIVVFAPSSDATEISSRAAARDLQSIIDAKVLRVAVTRFDLPGFHAHRSDGKLVGAEIEMAQQIAQALGVGVEFIENADSFDAVADLVASGSADIGISKLSQTYARLRHVRFSKPYITLRQAMLFNRAAIAREANGKPPATVLQKFHGRIGLTANSAYVEFAKANFPAATLVEARTWEDVIASLLAGKVDVIYRDEFEIRRILKNRPALNIQFGAAAIVDQYALLSIAICDTCSKLQEIINYHLQRTKNEFTLNALLNSEVGK
jgi:polar amino acid transport system substrate-binding protein